MATRAELTGDVGLLRDIWNEIDGLANSYIWQLLLAFLTPVQQGAGACAKLVQGCEGQEGVFRRGDAGHAVSWKIPCPDMSLSCCGVEVQ